MGTPRACGKPLLCEKSASRCSSCTQHTHTHAAHSHGVCGVATHARRAQPHLFLVLVLPQRLRMPREHAYNARIQRFA
jgi:hypothetical protein